MGLRSTLRICGIPLMVVILVLGAEVKTSASVTTEDLKDSRGEMPDEPLGRSRRNDVLISKNEVKPTRRLSIGWVQPDACPVCNASHTEQSVVFDHAIDFPQRKMIQCSVCSAVYVWPQPIDAELNKLYTNQKYYNSRGSVTKFARLQPSDQAKWVYERAIHAWAHMDAQFIDIGCGAGELLSSLAKQKLGSTVNELVCYEPDPTVAQSTEHSLRAAVLGANITVHASRFDRCNRAGNAALISMSHVLEHVATPHVLLARLVECLTPGGYLFFAVPNKPLHDENCPCALDNERNSKGRRGVERHNFFGVKHNFHLFYFTETSIRELLRSHIGTLELVNVESSTREVRVLVRKKNE